MTQRVTKGQVLLVEHAIVHAREGGEGNEAFGVRFNHFETSYGGRRGVGLWGLASFLNDAAWRGPATVTQTFHHGGRIMMLRAARDLAAGKELTVQYSPPAEMQALGQPMHVLGKM